MAFVILAILGIVVLALVVALIGYLVGGDDIVYVSGARDKPIKNTTMDIYPDALSFCYLHNKRVDGKRDSYVECNYVDMPQNKLEKVRDYLDNFSGDKK